MAHDARKWVPHPSRILRRVGSHEPHPSSSICTNLGAAWCTKWVPHPSRILRRVGSHEPHPSSSICTNLGAAWCTKWVPHPSRILRRVGSHEPHSSSSICTNLGAAWCTKWGPHPSRILRRVGSHEPHSSSSICTKLGAPGLDFETWENTNPNVRNLRGYKLDRANNLERAVIEQPPHACEHARASRPSLCSSLPSARRERSPARCA